MSMSRTALKLVQKSLPQLHLCKSVLVLSPTEHILRGYAFERTQLKGTFYLWRVVLPLYRRLPNLILNYSHRVPNGAHVHLSKENPKESAAVITKIISDDLPKLESIRTPRDFLDSVSSMIGNDTPRFLFDLALTYYLIGYLHEAFVTLQEAALAAEKSTARIASDGHFDNPNLPWLNELRCTATNLAAALKPNPAKVAAFISDCERANVIQFGLTETILAPRI